jgi:predicted glycosyltransferase
MVSPRDLDAPALAEALRRALTRERTQATLPLDLDGAGRVADELLELATKGR